MSAKENFNQAMFDMFGVGKDPNKKENTEAAKVNAESKANETKAAPKAEPVKTEPKAAPAQPKVYQRTVLGEGTVFEGNLSSKGDVEIAGLFKGDISTEGSVILRSDIEGNIKTTNLDVLANSLTGNVAATGKVNLAVGSRIKGNINAQSLVCSGKIVGDMVIENEASFDELSYVEGNITAKSITISHGAYIDGRISIKK